MQTNQKNAFDTLLRSICVNTRDAAQIIGYSTAHGVSLTAALLFLKLFRINIYGYLPDV